MSKRWSSVVARFSDLLLDHRPRPQTRSSSVSRAYSPSGLPISPFQKPHPTFSPNRPPKALRSSRVCDCKTLNLGGGVRREVWRAIMERMEGLRGTLICLSEEEQKGVKIVLSAGKEGMRKEAKALGKVMAEKPIYAEGLVTMLGTVGCPLKGIRRKRM